MGTPDYRHASIENAWLADTDNGPTKTYLWAHRDEPDGRRFYDLAFAKRPTEELYDLRTDPGQLTNLADDPTSADIKDELSRRLMDALAATGSNNPRTMAAGVSKATVSTLAGMVVAIFGMLVGKFAERRAIAEREALLARFIDLGGTHA